MKKYLAIFGPILVIGFGLIYYFSQQRPPVETKFVQDVGKKDARYKKEDESRDETAKQTIGVKKPGDNALLPNPNHTYQTFNNCGPATLSMILSWYGQSVNQKDLGDKMRPYQNSQGDNDDKTIFTYEFVEWAKKYGLEATGRVNGDIQLLKTFTSNGIPVVVKTWLHVNEDIGHFRIIRGFDERDAGLPAGRQVIIQDDSFEGPNKKISYYDFLSMWQPFNYAYIVVYTQDKSDLVAAILGEEMDESIAWENSLVRAEKEADLVPDNFYPVFNMATAHYHLGEYQKSVDAFEEVEKKLPKRMLWYQIEPIQAYIALGDYVPAFQIADNIIENGDRAFSELYQLKGEVYQKQGKKELARVQFELAIKYNEYYEPAKTSLSGLLDN